MHIIENASKSLVDFLEYAFYGRQNIRLDLSVDHLKSRIDNFVIQGPPVGNHWFNSNSTYNIRENGYLRTSMLYLRVIERDSITSYRLSSKQVST